MKTEKTRLFKPQQKGIILIITLVLMVVIALGAVASVRLSGVDELVNNNTRSRILAMQAANAAILSCRNGVFRSGREWHILPSGGVSDEGSKWQTIEDWADATKVNTITTNFAGYPQQPQCMIENITDFMAANSTSGKGEGDIIAYRITARGFSPNYQENSGVQVRGSQAWQQVVVGRILQ